MNILKFKDLVCDNGYFLSPPSTKCEPCNAGEYSFSGTLINDWSDLPESFKTSCTSEGGKSFRCASWKASANSKYFYSGDQSRSLGIVTSSLTYYVNILKEAGEVQFNFRVDADANDGLEFYIDNTLVMERTGYVHEYIVKSFPLAKGPHILEWRYNRTPPSSSSKEMAYLTWIKVYGEKLAVEKCSKCPKGTFNDEKGKESCKPCPFGSYNDQSGQSQCKQCPDNEFAYEGSTSCTPKQECTSNDYYAYHTPCSNGKRTLVYEWKSPRICSGGVALPEKKLNQECSQCPLGMYRENDVCQRCSGKGEYYDTTLKTCKICYENYAAIKYLRYDQNYFNEINGMPKSWTTKCIGECDKSNNGWTFNSNAETNEAYLDAAGNGYGDETVLTIPIQLHTFGTIEFQWELPDNNNKDDTSVLLFFVNKTLETDISRDNSPANKGTYKSKYYPPGRHLLSFAYDKYDTPYKQSTFRIRSIVIEGEEYGAAHTCAECKEGHYCTQATDEYLPCKPGTYSNLKQEYCMSCYRNTFQNKWGQNRCLNCGTGTYSDTGSAECINTCTYNVPGTELMYNITDLQEALDRELGVIGPLALPNSTFNLYFSLCQKFDTANTKFCTKESRSVVLEEQRREVTNKNRRKGYRTYSCIEDVSYANLKYKPSGDMGSTISYDASTGNGIKVMFSTDYRCPNNGGVYNTKIDLRCNPKVGLGKPVILTGANPDATVDDVCTTNILWESNVACPVCTMYDYESVLQPECENGQRKRTWYLKPGATCYPYAPMSTSLPQSELVPCTVCAAEDYTTVETKCENGRSTIKYVWKEPKICLDGESLPADRSIACDEFEIGKLTAVTALFIFGSVFVCLVAVIIFFYFKNKQLYSQYERVGGKENEFEMSPGGLGELELEGSDDEDSIEMGFTTTKNHPEDESDDEDRV